MFCLCPYQKLHLSHYPIPIIICILDNQFTYSCSKFFFFIEGVKSVLIIITAFPSYKCYEKMLSGSDELYFIWVKWPSLTTT